MLGGILGYVQVSEPTRTYGLWIDGLDVIARPAASYGVDPRSVTVVEAGPGDVSSMTFTLRDTTSQVTVAPGQVVQFMDFGFNVPLFVGYVESYAVSVLGVGREIDVTCVGIESALDWMYVPALTIAAGVDILTAFQSICGQAYGCGIPIRWAGANAGGSSIDTPMFTGASGGLAGSVAISAGTLRQALDQYGKAWATEFGADTGDFLTWLTTIDVWFGLRLYQDITGVADMLTITVTTASDPRPEGTEYRVGSAAARQAIASGSGSVTQVSDGSGIPGPFLTTDASNATTVQRRQALGLGAMAAQSDDYSGTTSITMTRTLLASKGVGSSSGQRRAGAQFVLTEAAVGASALTTRAHRITKTYKPSREETWVIEYGSALRQRGSSLLKRLTATNFA